MIQISYSLVALFLGAAFGTFVAKEWRAAWEAVVGLRISTNELGDAGACRVCRYDCSWTERRAHRVRDCARFLWRRWRS